MANLLTCPQGHQWNVPDDGNAPATGVRERCPVCGFDVDRPQQAQGLEAGKETVTALPLQPKAAPSLAETLPPNLALPQAGSVEIGRAHV